MSIRSGHVPSGRWRPTSVAVVGLASVAAWVLATNWTLDNVPYDTAGGIVLGPFLLGGALFWASAATRRDGLLTPWLLPTAVVVRLVGSVAFLWVASTVYEGFADAFAYARLGGELSERVGQGLVLDLTREDLGGFSLHGTGTIIVATAALFALIGRSTVAGFLVFALAGLLGHWLLYRAYRIAEPHGDQRMYGLLVLFFPSLVFWTSQISKEAWFALFLGAGAYGFARILRGQRVGYLLVAVSLIGMALVRPHVAAMFAIAAALGALRRRTAEGRPRRPVRAFVTIAFTVLAIGGTVKVTANFLEFDPAEADQVIAALQRASGQSARGGSRFEPVGVGGPRDVPAGAATVLFRPFPTEADSPMMVLAAAEGVVLMGLLGFALRRPREFVSAIRQRPYVAFATAFTALFVVAFSYVGNFGIVVRQRTMVLPFLFVLVTVHDRRAAR